jgi:hypothetical protein
MELTGIVPRLTEILSKPKETWEKISTEPGDVKSLFVPYVVAVAVVAAGCWFLLDLILLIRGLPFGLFMKLLLLGIPIYFVLMVFVFGLAVNFMAQFFESRQDSASAMKLAAYAATPAFLANVLVILCGLGGDLGWIRYLVFVIGAAGAFYLLQPGLPLLMGTAEDKKLPYAAAGAGIFLVLLAMAMELAWRIAVF